MSTKYKYSKDVPTEVLSARLLYLADIICEKTERIPSEFCMRVPAEVDRDADLVLTAAANRLDTLTTERDRLRELVEKLMPAEHEDGCRWELPESQECQCGYTDCKAALGEESPNE